MQESRSWPDPENPDKQDGGSAIQCWQALLVTPVCQSFCSQGGVVSQHALQVVSQHALQVSVGGVVYPSMHWDRPPPWTATAAGGYASYWNAFLLEFVVGQYLWGSTHNSLARLPSHRDTREVGCYQKPSKYFTRSIYLQHGEILEFSQIKWCDYNVLAFVSNFELGDNPSNGVRLFHQASLHLWLQFRRDCWIFVIFMLKKKHREKTKSTGITPGISTLSECSNLFRSDIQWKVSLIPLSHAGPLIFLQPAASSEVFPAPGSDGVSMLTK